jgi:GTP-binding protein
VFTKTDVLDQAEAEEIAARVVKELNWTAPWFMISSVTRSGTDELMQSVGRALDEMTELEQEQHKEWSLETGNDS